MRIITLHFIVEAALEIKSRSGVTGRQADKAGSKKQFVGVQMGIIAVFSVFGINSIELRLQKHIVTAQYVKKTVSLQHQTEYKNVAKTVKYL